MSKPKTKNKKARKKPTRKRVKAKPAPALEIDELLGEASPTLAPTETKRQALEPRDGTQGNGILPARYREALFHRVPDAMPMEFSRVLAAWLYANRKTMTRGGDPEGVSRFNWEITDVDRLCEHLGPLKKKIVAEIPAACIANKIPEFDLDHFEMHATLYHAGSHFDWHDDAPGYDGKFIESRRLSFTYYMHSDPKMFSGGELEFVDGSLIVPEDNALQMFFPLQKHRVREVECWSAHVLHGRWCIMGWIHGNPPDGYTEPRNVRGIPVSG